MRGAHVTVDVDLTNGADYQNGFPHAMFTALRAEGAVHHHAQVQVREGQPPLDFWSVVRHAEVLQANRDWQTFTATDSVTILMEAGTAIQVLQWMAFGFAAMFSALVPFLVKGAAEKANAAGEEYYKEEV